MLLPEENLDLRYGLRRLGAVLRPPVDISPPPTGVRFDRDVAVPMRDGVTLRANVFRPAQGGPFPVIMSAHPYSKDALPTRFVGTYLPAVQYRILRQTRPVRFSAWTSWEAPDPAYWTARGYAVVNADLRGFFRSEGAGDLLTDQEGQDYHDLVEWAGTQPWSTGKVGLNGVSYLAMSQWRVAALRPPHLHAICPWEGLTDIYRDLACPGGIREQGFFALWAKTVLKAGRHPVNLLAEQLARPLRDAFWDARTPDLAQIEVPALVCGSFSDHNLHSGGSFEGFRQIRSRYKWLYTHGEGKWAVYYSPEALALQSRFFDCFLKGEDNGMREVPPVRLEVRASGAAVHAVREESRWPLAGTRWTALHLHADGALREGAPAASAVVRFDAATGRASFTWTSPGAVEIVGPLKLRLHVAVTDADDLCLFAGLRKLDPDGAEVFFEGSYGFARDMPSHGWLRVSHRELDEARSEPFRPVHRHRRALPLAGGQVVAVELELLPLSVFLAAGESLRLDLQGHWFHATNPLLGGAAGYESSPGGTAEVHLGGPHDAHLLLPLQPAPQTP